MIYCLQEVSQNNLFQVRENSYEKYSIKRLASKESQKFKVMLKREAKPEEQWKKLRIIIKNVIRR